MKFTRCLLLSLCLPVCASLAQDHGARGTTGLPPGVYCESPNGKLYPMTNINVAALWPGVFKDDTNGLRVQLYVGTDGGQKWLRIGVGSVVFNSLGGFIGAPGESFQKIELRNSNGIVVPFVHGKTVQGRHGSRISVNDLSRWSDGGLRNHIGFFTNGGPATLQDLKLNDLYRLPSEGDYTLTVCPVIYKFGTNRQYADRVDLPCLTTNIHLTP